MSHHAHAHAHRVHWLLWPVWALWRFLTLIIEFTGRLVAVLLGAVLMIAGVILSLTIVGAIAGIPILALGLLLTLRGIF